MLFKGYGAKICRLTTYVKAENRMVTEMNADYVLQVISLHRKTLRENKVGSAIPHLNKKLFKAIEVPIPPYNQQKKIVEAINIMFKHLDAIMESL